MLKELFKKNKELETEEYKVNSIDTGEASANKIKKIINIVFIVVLALAILISIDIVCVAKFKVGPFFAIRTNVYKDGGTKVYYGFGYKVIKYKQIQGRRDTTVGFWNMPYSVEPTNVSILDLAIELRNYPEENYKKYAGKFLRIKGIVDSVDTKAKSITLKYTDPDGEYTLEVICSMAEKDTIVSDFEVGNSVEAIGTVDKFAVKTSKESNKLFMIDCFAE